MRRFIEGEDRSQGALFPESPDDYITKDNSVWVIDVFVDELDLVSLGFDGMEPEATGRPGYHPQPAQDLHLWLSQSGPVQSAPGARDVAQCGADLVNRQADAGLQD